MAQTYLHVGITKPVTMALQRWLARNEPALRPLSTFAPPQRIAHRLAVEGITSAQRRSEHDIVGIMKSPLDQARTILRQAAKSEISRIFLSSEYFSIGDPAAVRSMLSELSMDHVKIVLVLRRQDRLVEDAYEHGVRLGGRKEPIRKPHYNKTMDWFELASAWADAFSRENLLVQCYDEDAGSGHAAVVEILKSIDAELGALAARTGEDKALPPAALPADLLEFKRLANRAGAPDVMPLLDKAKALGFGAPPFRLDRDIAKELLAFYRDSNRKVARQFFGRKGDLFDQSDLGRKPQGADFTGKLPIETLTGLFALYMQEQAARAGAETEGAPRESDRPEEDGAKAAAAPTGEVEIGEHEAEEGGPRENANAGAA